MSASKLTCARVYISMVRTIKGQIGLKGRWIGFTSRQPRT